MIDLPGGPLLLTRSGTIVKMSKETLLKTYPYFLGQSALAPTGLGQQNAVRLRKRKFLAFTPPEA
jgi:hypothetical protein